MRKLAIILVSVLVVLVIGDRVADYAAEKAVASTIQDSDHLQSEPDVDIKGFPFLTQMITRDLDDVTITAKNVPTSDNANALLISRVTADMRDVKVDLSLDRVTIGTGHATALIRYADLTKALGFTFSYAGNGKVTADRSITILGHTYDAGVTISPQLAGGALDLTSALSGGHGVPTSVLARIADLLGANIPLDRIPFGLNLQSVAATSAGISITLGGHNVTISKPK